MRQRPNNTVRHIVPTISYTMRRIQIDTTTSALGLKGIEKKPNIMSDVRVKRSARPKKASVVSPEQRAALKEQRNTTIKTNRLKAKELLGSRCYACSKKDGLLIFKSVDGFSMNNAFQAWTENTIARLNRCVLICAGCNRLPHSRENAVAYLAKRS